MFHHLVFVAASLTLLNPLSADDVKSPFAFRQSSPTTLELTDGAKPVFVYNFGMTLAKGFPKAMRRSSYLHPVYSPGGVQISDDFNPNHPHHRGISWMWPEVTVDGKKGDIWTIVNFKQKFVAWKAQATGQNTARLAVENGWYDGDRKFVKENVDILVHAVQDGHRVLEFTLQFEALDRPVVIAGTPDGKKGFGGFCFRFATPDGGGANTVIRTEHGIAKKDGVMSRHPWAQISGTYHGRAAGARIDDDLSNPGAPKNGWLMRHELCCLNVSYPGLTPLTLEAGKPLVLRYKVTLFDGDDLK